MVILDGLVDDTMNGIIIVATNVVIVDNSVSGIISSLQMNFPHSLHFSSFSGNYLCIHQSLSSFSLFLYYYLFLILSLYFLLILISYHS